MRRKPYRMRNDEISQSYNDGIVAIYSAQDVAKPGFRPSQKLTLRVKLQYAERRVGIQRYYAAKQNQTQVERVIRCQNCGGISNQDIAITEDGKQYRIDLVQLAPDVYPPSVDITLRKIEQKVETEAITDEMV